MGPGMIKVEIGDGEQWPSLFATLANGGCIKVTHQISAELIDNREQFTGEFYERFQLRHADRPLQLTENISKNYFFPTFYGDVTCAIAIFFCSYEAAQSLLPHRSMRPVSMGHGRALLTISCYEYKKILGVPPYNELALTIPVQVDGKFCPPVLPILMPQLFSSFGYHCFSMPVTSLENQIRGEKIWGLPKVVHEINFHHQQDMCQVEVLDEEGRNYLKIKIPKKGRRQHFDVSAYLYMKKEGQLLRGKTAFKGDFQVKKYMKNLFSPLELGVVSPCLTLGNGPHAQLLKKLQIDPRPFQFRYCPNMQSCFDLPERCQQT